METDRVILCSTRGVRQEVEFILSSVDGGLQVTNIFSLVSTDPAALYTTEDPVGPDNNAAILDAIKDAGMVLCAWGNHGAHVGRAREVVDMLRSAGATPHSLGQNTDGSPKHPLYVAYATLPKPFFLD
ncbi:MAG: DUF1643 domain-containing protein [Burkholderiales bacterium]|nr:DUF1643 domain-containing protein [Sulfuricella sp.]